MVVLAVLTAASVTTTVALALLPALMVFHCSKSLNWAASALGCAISWFFMLFVTVFLGLELNDQQPSYFAEGGPLNILAYTSVWVGCGLFAASLGNVLLRRHLKAKKGC